MRSTTSPRPTCTPSCTRSTPPYRRHGKPAPIGTRSRRSRRNSRALAEKHLGARRDIIAAPLAHDTPDEIAQPHGRVLDWRAGECEPIPGKTMPKLIVVERDYPDVAAQHAALGPLTETLGSIGQGRVLEAGRRGRVARSPERTGARRNRRRPAVTRSCRSTPARQSWRSPAPPTAASRWRDSRRSSSARGVAAGVAGRAARGRANHLRRRSGAAAHGDDVPRMVGHRRARPPLQPIHHQRRARQALAHPLRPAALLRRSRMDARAGRGTAQLPAAAGARQPHATSTAPAAIARSSPCATSRHTRSGRSTPSTRTTCTC